LKLATTVSSLLLTSFKLQYRPDLRGLKLSLT